MGVTLMYVLPKAQLLCTLSYDMYQTVCVLTLIPHWDKGN